MIVPSVVVPAHRVKQTRAGGRIMAAITLTAGRGPPTGPETLPRTAPGALTFAECQSARSGSLAELISHIVRVHHRRLRRQLVRMWTFLDQLLDETHSACPTILPIREVFESVLDKLVDCMLRERSVVFPQIERLEAATAPAVPSFAAPLLDDAIDDLERRQHTCLLGVRKLNELTGQAAPALKRFAEYREFAEELALFSSDLFQYLFEVNCLLLGRAKAMSTEHRPMSPEVR
jgi:iron-sulfur cluster repair protein YtfE (RIC family)